MSWSKYDCTILLSLEGKFLVKDTTQKLKSVYEVERLVANRDSA